MSIPEISGIAGATTTSPVQAQATVAPPVVKHGHEHGHVQKQDTVSISPQATQLASAVDPSAKGESSAKAK